MANFDPLRLRNRPLNRSLKICYRWLKWRLIYHCQIWCKSPGVFCANGWNINGICISFFRNSQSRRPVDRDAPNNTDSRKGVHLGSHWHCSPFRGSNQPKLRHTAQCILPVKSLSCRWSASIYDSPAAKDHRATKRGLTSFLNPDFNRPLVSIQVCNSGWLGTIYPSYIS